MSVVVESYPVETVSGIIENIIPGFEDVEIIFKREDLHITGIELGANNRIRVNISTDLTSYLRIGDFVYVGSTGVDGYIYDDNGEITQVTSTYIEIDIDYVSSSTGGYINYLKNYYIEVDLIDVDNSAIKILPFTLRDDGNLNGQITINVGIANDKNEQIFETENTEIIESRLRFDVNYREVYEGQLNTSYTTIDNYPIILVYATEQMVIEKFENKFEYPEIYQGYNNGVIFMHSDENDNEGTAGAINITYNELDNNQNAITSDNEFSGKFTSQGLQVKSKSTPSNSVMS